MLEVNFRYRPVAKKTRGISSLRGIQKPDELDDLMLVSIVSQIGKCLRIMGGRMPFAPTKMDYFQCNLILKILIQTNIYRKYSSRVPNSSTKNNWHPRGMPYPNTKTTYLAHFSLPTLRNWLFTKMNFHHPGFIFFLMICCRKRKV